MHPRELGRRVSEASRRIAAAGTALPDAFGVDVGKLTLNTKTARQYPEDGAMEQMEAVAEFMEAVLSERRGLSADKGQATKERKALEAERDAARHDAGTFRARLLKAEEERDALASEVAGLQKALDAALNPPPPPVSAEIRAAADATPKGGGKP